jgi:succinoglycan biosynthesis transport protein ExoP
MKIPPSAKSKFSAIVPQSAQNLAPPQESPAIDDEGLWDVNWVMGVLRRKALLILAIALSTTALATGALLLASSMTKPKYKGIFQLQVEPATAEAKSSRSFLRGQSTERSLDDAQTANLEQSATLDYETQIRILTSSKPLDPVVEQIQRRYPEINYESLIEDLNVERVKITKDGKEQGTKLLKVEYTAADAQQILLVLDLISQEYLKYSLKERQANIRQGIKFIDQQTPQLRQQVNKVQTQIQALRQQSNLMDPEQQGVEFAQLLSTLKRQQFDTQAKLAEVQSNYQTLKQKFDRGNAIAVMSEMPSAQKSIDRYRDLENQIAISASRFQENSPSLQALRSEQKNIKVLLDREAAQILASAADRVAAVKTQQQAIVQSQANLTKQFQRLPAVSAKYAALKQELKISTETLDRYLSKREVLGIDVAQQEIPWELTTRPTLIKDIQGKPINFSALNKRTIVALSAVLAILLAVAVAFLIEILQDIIYTPTEIQRLSKLPVLGTIPVFNNSNFRKLFGLSNWLNIASSVTNFSSRTSEIQFFKEAFNLLYSNIDYAVAKLHVQTIAISSLGSQEGKSMIATNLARAAAIAGNRVLLVDADLRSPRLHTYLKLDNSQGLSDSIESNVAVHQFIQPSVLDDNLFVLTAGQVLSNPVRLLSSPKLKSLVEQFAAEFDLVIYDTPPVNFADLSWLGAQVDGIILVAKLGKTRRTALAQAIQDLRHARLPLLGFVANGANSIIAPDVTASTSKLHYSHSDIFLPAGTLDD